VTLNTYSHVVEGMQAPSAQIRRWIARRRKSGSGGLCTFRYGSLPLNNEPAVHPGRSIHPGRTLAET